jgi:predicted aspartyl protease
VETNSTVTVVGKIEDQVITMLVDTGSAVTVVRADLWESITGGHPIELKPPQQPVVVADGKALEQLGQASVLIQVGGVSAQQIVLVVQKLTQECLLGADFLERHGCVIDLQRHHLLAGGEAVPLQSLSQRPETLSV